MKKSVFARSFAILLISCIFCSILSECGSSSKSSSSEPPVYSPLRVLVPEAPGSDTLGSSPLTLDVSNITQGYFAAQSDSADLVDFGLVCLYLVLFPAPFCLDSDLGFDLFVFCVCIQT